MTDKTILREYYSHPGYRALRIHVLEEMHKLDIISLLKKHSIYHDGYGYISSIEIASFKFK